MSRDNTSYIYVDKFIQEHSLDHIPLSNSKYNFTIRLFMGDVYLFIHRDRIDNKAYLVMETFPLDYREYAFKWPGNEDNFVNIINSLGIIKIRKGYNSPDLEDLGYEQESLILRSVLEFLISNKDYIATRYDLK